MSKLPKGRVLEFRKHHIEALGAWIEVAVFAEEDLLGIMGDIDLTDLELEDYKVTLVSGWPGLSNEIRARLTPEAIGEIYDLIITLNPLLHPKNVVQIETFERETPDPEVMKWFASGGTMGKKPRVINAETN